MKLCCQRVTFRLSSIKTEAVEINKTLNGMSPEYLSNIPYLLRDRNKLIQPLKRTTTFGIKSLAYFGEPSLKYVTPSYKINSLSLCNFQNMIGKWSGPTCHCCVCTLVVGYQYPFVINYCFIGHCPFNVFCRI